MTINSVCNTSLWPLDLSEKREKILRKCEYTHIESVESARNFEKEFTRMGFFDHLLDFFYGGYKKNTLEALAIAHIASFANGQQYLIARGEEHKIADASLYLLDCLKLEARSAMLNAPVLLKTGEIGLIFPAVDGGNLPAISLPLPPSCFGSANGALSTAETAILHERLSNKYPGGILGHQHKLSDPIRQGKNASQEIEEEGNRRRQQLRALRCNAERYDQVENGKSIANWLATQRAILEDQMKNPGAAATRMEELSAQMQERQHTLDQANKANNDLGDQVRALENEVHRLKFTVNEKTEELKRQAANALPSAEVENYVKTIHQMREQLDGEIKKRDEYVNLNQEVANLRQKLIDNEKKLSVLQKQLLESQRLQTPSHHQSTAQEKNGAQAAKPANPPHDRLNEPSGDCVKGQGTQVVTEHAIAVRRHGRQPARLLAPPTAHAAKRTDVPYLSQKRDEKINLNCKTNFIGDPDELIECRHLSLAWVDNFLSKQGKVDYKLFSTPKILADNVSIDYENIFLRTIERSKVSLVSFSEWGREIHNKFEQMELNKKTFDTILLNSLNHVMALGLRIKQKEGGLRAYVVMFYDPNSTVAHKRLEAIDRDSLRGYTAQDFLPKKDLDFYEMDCTAFLDAPVNDEPRLAALPQSISAAIIQQLLTYGLADGLRHLRDLLKATPAADRLSLLTGENRAGVPSILIALQHGYAEAIRAFGELVKAAELQQQQLFELLAAKRSSDGAPGLHMALSAGHAEAIHAFGELIKAAGLPPAHLGELLAAKRDDGIPGLCFSLQGGHAEAIRAFGVLVKAAKLPQQQLVELLAAKRSSDGVPGLHMALSAGHAEAIHAFGELIEAAGLPPAQLGELLAAKRDDGIPGLRFSLQNGHADAIRAFGVLVKAAKLPPQQSVELLAAKNVRGTPGLSLALQSGHAEAIRAFGDSVKAVGLPHAQLVELLAAKRDSDGVSGLQIARACHQKAAVIAYSRLLHELMAARLIQEGDVQTLLGV
ncbi:ShET2/EspL2 family type III secretion system effector toxin [Cupriavidus pampae]|uniref:ShET2 enterotoxin N-terminal domain-containing protein n=1 Tax=Cupriavidus pampae TaxID=659251 RepID=A0ABM8Y2W3_9BURK|nr:ShET2/EspL2 family type III secretion system effector toxin [Cupriavidus pampae]CAG9186984.1 hypothetical protein LMG32289_06723 [Cupriavidus pampae]